MGIVWLILLCCFVFGFLVLKCRWWSWQGQKMWLGFVWFFFSRRRGLGKDFNQAVHTFWGRQKGRKWGCWRDLDVSPKRTAGWNPSYKHSQLGNAIAGSLNLKKNKIKFFPVSKFRYFWPDDNIRFLNFIYNPNFAIIFYKHWAFSQCFLTGSGVCFITLGRSVY